jgi:hypothetical protein
MRGGTITIALVALLAGCGGGGSNTAIPIGSEVRTAFLNALDTELNAPGWTAQIGSQCRDQDTGVSLGQMTSGELSAAGNDMLFHCSVDLRSGTYGQLGELYYLTVKARGNWSALWEPIPLLPGYDVKDPCTGAACTGVFLSLTYGDNLAGNIRSGAVTGSGSRRTSSSTTTTPAATGFGGCPAGEDRNDTDYCIPLDEPGTTCAAGESKAACGPAGRGSHASTTPPKTTTTASQSGITAHVATPSEVAEFTATASSAGLLTSGYYLGDARVTSNGWAVAAVLSNNPAESDQEDIAFRLDDGHWKYIAAGSSFSGSAIPAAVIRAFYSK